jgi:hypothetical protein
MKTSFIFLKPNMPKLKIPCYLNPITLIKKTKKKGKKSKKSKIQKFNNS